MGHTHRYKFGFKKKKSKDSQYMASHPELGSDPLIGSDQESGCDNNNYRSVSITISEGSPYKISIVGVGPIDIHRRVVR